MQNVSNRLKQQLAFITEIDKLKLILRRTSLIDQSRPENSAEHSWHLALMAMVLAEYAPPEVNISRVIKMVLLHDVVEIDAGDTFLYDLAHAESKAERELLAAERIYGLLPTDIAQELYDYWQEFEARETPDAKFAACLDRIQPILHNYHAEGGTWLSANVSQHIVTETTLFIKDSSEDLWQLVDTLITDAINKGYLRA